MLSLQTSPATDSESRKQCFRNLETPDWKEAPKQNKTKTIIILPFYVFMSNRHNPPVRTTHHTVIYKSCLLTHGVPVLQRCEKQQFLHAVLFQVSPTRHSAWNICLPENNTVYLITPLPMILTQRRERRLFARCLWTPSLFYYITNRFLQRIS